MAQMKIVYGNVRNKIPTYDVRHSIGIALILGIFFVTVLLVVFSTILGCYIYRKIKKARKDDTSPSQNNATEANQDEVLT